MLSLIGRGAKTVGVYRWGPAAGTGGDTWSDRVDLYPQIARALQQVGWGERILYPGRPARGTVQSSLLAAARCGIHRRATRGTDTMSRRSSDFTTRSGMRDTASISSTIGTSSTTMI